MDRNDIIKKKFSHSFTGYDISEVDFFLDEIIREFDRRNNETSLLEFRIEHELVTALKYIRLLRRQLKAQGIEPTEIPVSIFDDLKELTEKADALDETVKAEDEALIGSIRAAAAVSGRLYSEERGTRSDKPEIIESAENGENMITAIIAEITEDETSLKEAAPRTAETVEEAENALSADISAKEEGSDGAETNPSDESPAREENSGAAEPACESENIEAAENTFVNGDKSKGKTLPAEIEAEFTAGTKTEFAAETEDGFIEKNVNSDETQTEEEFEKPIKAENGEILSPQGFQEMNEADANRAEKADGAFPESPKERTDPKKRKRNKNKRHKSGETKAKTEPDDYEEYDKKKN